MFTRLKYDQDTYATDLYESTAVGDYKVLPESTHQGNQNTCFVDTPEIANGMGQYKISQKNDMVNAESDLRNLNRKASEDPMTQYPFTKVHYENVPSTGSCTHKNLEQRYGKLEGSQFNREKQIDIPRFESLCLNPQELTRIRSNNYIGKNTQLYYRDNKTQNRIKPLNENILPNASNEYVSPFMQKYSNYQQTKVEKKDKEIVEKFGNCNTCVRK
jgi:hypothetical protein